MQDVLNAIKVISPYLKNADKLKQDIFSEVIRGFTKELNQELLDQGLISKGKDLVHYAEKFLFSNQPPCLYLLSPKVMKIAEFPESMSVEEKFKLFEESTAGLREKAFEVANRIHVNRLAFTKIIEEIREELAPLMPEPSQLSFSQDTYYTYEEGIESFVLRYKGEYMISQLVHLYLEHTENNYALRKKMMKIAYEQEIQKYYERKKEQHIATIRDYVRTVCSQFKSVRFKIVEELPNGELYNIEKGVFSLQFDIADEKLKKQFVSDIEQAIQEVKKHGELKEINPKEIKDIHLGGYHFYLREEKTIGEDTYHVYESKIDPSKKSLLVIYKNGVRLGIKPRRKALQLLGFVNYAVKV